MALGVKTHVAYKHLWNLQMEKTVGPSNQTGKEEEMKIENVVGNRGEHRLVQQ